MENFISEFDDQLLKIDQLNHLPWIGKDYSNSTRRILVVGDSHYDSEADDEDEKTFTRGIINCCLQPGNSWSMQRNFLLTFLPNDNAAEAFWNHVAFCNIIQELLPESDSQPSVEQYVKGGKILNDIILVLKPTDIIVVGKRCQAWGAYNWMYDNHILDYDFSPIKINRTSPIVGHYKNCDVDAKLINIQHTSSYYSIDKWANFIKQEMPEAFEMLSSIQ